MKHIKMLLNNVMRIYIQVHLQIMTVSIIHTSIHNYQYLCICQAMAECLSAEYICDLHD